MVSLMVKTCLVLRQEVGTILHRKNSLEKYSFYLSIHVHDQKLYYIWRQKYENWTIDYSFQFKANDFTMLSLNHASYILKSWRSQHTIHICCIKFEVTVHVIIVRYKIMDVDQGFI